MFNESWIRNSRTASQAFMLSKKLGATRQFWLALTSNHDLFAAVIDDVMKKQAELQFETRPEVASQGSQIQFFCFSNTQRITHKEAMRRAERLGSWPTKEDLFDVIDGMISRGRQKMEMAFPSIASGIVARCTDETIYSIRYLPEDGFPTLTEECLAKVQTKDGYWKSGVLFALRISNT